MIQNLARHFTKDEKVAYKAIMHDLEETRATIGALEIQREKLIKGVIDRVGTAIIENTRV